MKKIIIFAVLILSLIVLSSCNSSNSLNNNVVEEIRGDQITVFKAQECGCCGGYIAELQRQGLNVDVKSVVDVTPKKDEYNIPNNMRSCHTTRVGNYFIEGHVPMVALNKLLEEKPDIDGIALPGMPSGSAGMPGPKTEKFKIYAIKNGQTSLFMEI